MIDLDYAWRCLPELGRGLLVTLQATLLGMSLALIVGLAWAALANSTNKLLSGTSRICVETIRSTPLLIQLYALFYVAPQFGLRMSPLTAGIVGIGLHYSAYLAEVYRAGIAAVPTGQWEAAATLGMSRIRSFITVIIPQALPPMVPAIGNYLLSMFKDTPVLSAITVVELLQRAKLIGSDEFRYLEPLTMVGLIFLLLSLAASRGIARLEART